MFTFSADGQYIFTHENGLIKKYDFSTGELVESLTLDNGGTGGHGIAHTGQYLITCGGYDRLNAHNEQGNYIGQIVFPNQVYSHYGTPSYTNGLCFTNTNDWFAWDIDDGMVTTSGCTDPYAENYNADANMDDGSCTYPDNGNYSLSFDGDGNELSTIGFH